MGKEDMLHDRLLGMLAVEKRFISEKQLRECMNVIELFEPDKTLREILLRKNYLTKAQIERLENELFPETSKIEEQPVTKQQTFGEIALQRNMIDQSQLEKAIEEQQKYVSRGLHPQLGQVMFKIGFLTLPQVKKILEAQLKKVLYCAKCKISKVIFNYSLGVIYTCEACGLDLIENQEKKAQIVSEEVSDESDNFDLADLGLVGKTETSSKSKVEEKASKTVVKSKVKNVKTKVVGRKISDDDDDDGIGTLKTLEI